MTTVLAIPVHLLTFSAAVAVCTAATAELALLALEFNAATSTYISNGTQLTLKVYMSVDTRDTDRLRDRV